MELHVCRSKKCCSLYAILMRKSDIQTQFQVPNFQNNPVGCVLLGNSYEFQILPNIIRLLYLFCYEETCAISEWVSYIKYSRLVTTVICDFFLFCANIILEQVYLDLEVVKKSCLSLIKTHFHDEMRFKLGRFWRRL